MGWTGTRGKKGESKKNAVLRIGCIDPARVVASNTKGNAVYMALRCKDAVVGVVALVEKDRDGYTNVKVMDEGMGPYYFDASAKVINALTSTTSEHANGWRADCLAATTRKNAAKAISKRAILGKRLLVTKDIMLGRSGKVPVGTAAKVVEKRTTGTLVFSALGIHFKVGLDDLLTYFA